MSGLDNLRLFATHPHPCSYLPGRTAKTLFIDPEALITRSQHSRLSALGFRRSGSHYYRPFCDECRACVPCRVKVDDFKLSRRFRRIIRRNQDIVIKLVKGIADQEHFDLYTRYINERHVDGDMYPATADQYRSFLLAHCESTAFYEMRSGTRLVGVFICDELDDGLSAVYTFFDPDEDKRSLGTLAVLWQIIAAARLELPYVYLGYWIKGCRKMHYKAQFTPLELLTHHGWHPATSSELTRQEQQASPRA